MNFIPESVRHTFGLQDGQQVDARFPISVAEAATTIKASSIEGTLSDVDLWQLSPETLFLCYDSIVKWNGICFINLNKIEGIEAIDCREGHKQFVRTTIHTPAGPFVCYERQQKLKTVFIYSLIFSIY
jgi:hypothetical protein